MKIRWGVLSTAKIGTEKVIPAMQRGAYCDMRAIASRDLDQARKVADQLGFPLAYGSYEELLDDPEIDAVYIPLPNHLHVPWSIKALEAGKHVLCEKPIGLSSAEARQLLDADRQHPKQKVMEAFMYRHHPQWVLAKKLVSEGGIGELRSIQTFFSYYNVDPTNIRNMADIGGGGLMDIGCYCISLSRFIFGDEPQKVWGIVENDPKFQVDRMASGMLEFAQGTSTFTCATQLADFQRVNIVGTEGRVEIEIPFNAPPDRPCRMWHQRGEAIEEIVLDVVDQYTIQGDLFSLAVLNDGPVPTPLEDAVANMVVIEAISRSAEAGGVGRAGEIDNKLVDRDRLHSLERQRDCLDGRLQSLRRTSRRYSYARLAAFVAGLLVTGLAFHFAGWRLATVCLLAGAGILFGVFVFVHWQVETGIYRHQIWRAFKSAQIARARRDWPNIPNTFAHRPQPNHPFEADMDLVGRRSLHRLLDTAVSYEGSQRLRDWLTAPVPDREETLDRQRLVHELVRRSLFREKLILSAAESAGATRTWDANHLVQWLALHSPDRMLDRWLALLLALATVNAALFLANLLGFIPAWWQLTFVIYLALMLVTSRSTARIWDEALALGDALRQLGAVFQHLENFGYHGTPGLRALCTPFLDHAHRPSRYVAHINQVVAAMGVRGNPLLWFALNAVIPWDLFFAHRLNRTKAAMAQRAPIWLNTWFELEALGSLANLGYLNPGYALPELLPVPVPERTAVLEVRDLGHPLIPAQERVCNDFSVSRLGQVTIITGSNMAGKSVFLKTMGANLALAYAGGPVNAAQLRTLPFRLFASMAVADSVTDGISYFYAEVRRLKALLEALEGDHSLPLLYCIDEIFRGTNNRERLAGSRAYVRALAGKRGVGFIASHDLALAELAGEVPQVANYHFHDEVAGDRMAFDYVLRPGPCPTTNALRIMALEGLPVPPGEDAPA